MVQSFKLEGSYKILKSKIKVKYFQKLHSRKKKTFSEDKLARNVR